MTRFIMSVEQSVSLLIASLKQAKGGEVYVMKMPSVRIADLAKVLVDHYSEKLSLPDIDVQYIGQRPGEKMYEELITEEEIRRTTDEGDFYVIRPAFDKVFSCFHEGHAKMTTQAASAQIGINDYRSDHVTQMSADEIHDFLLTYNLFREV